MLIAAATSYIYVKQHNASMGIYSEKSAWRPPSSEEVSREVVSQGIRARERSKRIANLYPAEHCPSIGVKREQFSAPRSRTVHSIENTRCRVKTYITQSVRGIVWRCDERSDASKGINDK